VLALQKSDFMVERGSKDFRMIKDVKGKERPRGKGKTYRKGWHLSKKGQRA